MKNIRIFAISIFLLATMSLFACANADSEEESVTIETEEVTESEKEEQDPEELPQPLSPDMISDSSRWYYTISDNTYGYTDSIEYDIIPYDDYQSIEWNYYYEYYYNGELVYTSDNLVAQGYWVEAEYGSNQDAELLYEGALASGEYRVVIYSVNGSQVLVDSSCTVGTTSDENAAMLDRVEWYLADSGVYTDCTSIELDIIPTTDGENVEWDFYYEYYYDDNLVYTSGICSDMGHWIETYYNSAYCEDITYDSTGLFLAPGNYRCVIYALDGTSLADATCTVISSADSELEEDEESTEEISTEKGFAYE